MSIDLSRVTGISDSYGAIKQIADSAGRVLWSATIKFTMNGVTYEADRGMTWAEWFASEYNTTGETEGDITDADGNAVSLDAVIVGGTVYDISFAKMATLTIGHFSTNHYSISVDGVAYSDTTLTVPVGTIVEIKVFDIHGDCKHHDSNVSIYVNDNCVMNNDADTTYSHTVTGDTELSERLYNNTCNDCYRYYYQYNVYITEE